MLYPAINTLIEQKNQCRYSLCMAVAKEARSISERAKNADQLLSEPPIKTAVHAISRGQVVYHEIRDEEN